jgi:hypothetical protein
LVDVGTSITDDASTSDIATLTTQTIDGGVSDSRVGELIGMSSTLPVDDTPTCDVRSSYDGVRAPINDDDDVSVKGIAASTIRTVDDSSSSSGDVAASLSTAGALPVGCASNDDDDLAADGIDASTDGEDAPTSDSDTVPLIIWSVDHGLDVRHSTCTTRNAEPDARNSTRTRNAMQNWATRIEVPDRRNLIRRV